MTARDAAVTPVVPVLEMAPRHPPPERRLNLYVALAVAALASALYVVALLLDFVPPRGLAVEQASVSRGELLELTIILLILLEVVLFVLGVMK